MAEFENATALVEAATKARLAGYRKMDAYSPIPIEELNEALDLKRTRLPLLVLLGGIFGGLGGFSLEYWSSVIAYPMNVGDRPLNSWPQFIPVTFETLLRVNVSHGIARSVQVTPGGFGTTQAFDLVALRGFASPEVITAYSLSQAAILFVFNIAFGLIALTWAFGWQRTARLIRLPGRPAS